MVWIVSSLNHDNYPFEVSFCKICSRCVPWDMLLIWVFYCETLSQCTLIGVCWDTAIVNVYEWCSVRHVSRYTTAFCLKVHLSSKFSEIKMAEKVVTTSNCNRAFVVQHLVISQHCEVCGDRGTRTSLMTNSNNLYSPNILLKMHNNSHTYSTWSVTCSLLKLKGSSLFLTLFHQEQEKTTLRTWNNELVSREIRLNWPRLPLSHSIHEFDRFCTIAVTTDCHSCL